MNEEEARKILSYRDSHDYGLPKELYTNFLENAMNAICLYRNNALKPYEAFEVIADLSGDVFAKRLSTHYIKPTKRKKDGEFNI